MDGRAGGDGLPAILRGAGNAQEDMMAKVTVTTWQVVEFLRIAHLAADREIREMIAEVRDVHGRPFVAREWEYARSYETGGCAAHLRKAMYIIEQLVPPSFSAEMDVPEHEPNAGENAS